jgi:hypothetical protein
MSEKLRAQLNGGLCHGHKWDADNPRETGTGPKDNRNKYIYMYNVQMLIAESKNNILPFSSFCSSIG